MDFGLQVFLNCNKHTPLFNIPSLWELMISFHIPLSLGFTQFCPLWFLQARFFSSHPKLVLQPCWLQGGLSEPLHDLPWHQTPPVLTHHPPLHIHVVPAWEAFTTFSQGCISNSTYSRPTISFFVSPTKTCSLFHGDDSCSDWKQNYPSPFKSSTSNLSLNSVHCTTWAPVNPPPSLQPPRVPEMNASSLLTEIMPTSRLSPHSLPIFSSQLSEESSQTLVSLCHFPG